MFARFDENPALTLQDIKKKRYGRTDAHTDNVKTNKVCGGYKNKSHFLVSKGVGVLPRIFFKPRKQEKPSLVSFTVGAILPSVNDSEDVAPIPFLNRFRKICIYLH